MTSDTVNALADHLERIDADWRKASGYTGRAVHRRAYWRNMAALLLADKHDKRDIRAENLAALCQRCHLNHDREEHAANARATRERKRAEREPMFTTIQP